LLLEKVSKDSLEFRLKACILKNLLNFYSPTMKVIHIILLKFKHQAIIQLRLILKSLFGCGEEPSVGNLVWLQQ
jgi:hypothetical protein